MRSCRRLTYIKSDLRLYILPFVYHCIVHMYRIPHDVCKKTYCIFVKFLRRLDHDISTLRIVRPVFCFYGLTCRTVNHFPPSVNIVSCIDRKHVRIQVIHQMNFKFFFYCCMERSHNIHLLDFFRMCLRPCIIFTCCIISRIDLRTGIFQFLRKLCAITVTDCICAPFSHNIQCFLNHIKVCRYCHTSFFCCHFYILPI